MRFGIVGSGGMGQTWAEVAARCVAGASLAAVWGGHNAEALAGAHGVPAEPTLRALLVRDDVDAVAITTPQETHAEFAIAAARAGKHLFVEKPMSLTVAEADAMVEASASAGVTLAVVSQHRFRPTPLAARMAIVRGDLGALRMVEARGAMAWPAFRRDRAPWVELGAHLCDLLRWLVGSEPLDVSARVTTFGPPAEFPQTVMATFAFASGVLARVWLTFELPEPGLGSQVEFTIVGSEGMLELDSYGVVRLGTRNGWRVLAEQPQGNPDDPFDPTRLQSYADQLRDFVELVAARREPVVDGQAGRTTIAMLEAAIRSDRERRTVEIAAAPRGDPA